MKIACGMLARLAHRGAARKLLTRTWYAVGVTMLDVCMRCGEGLCALRNNYVAH